MYRELVVLKAELSGDTARDVLVLGPSVTDPASGQQAIAFVNGRPVVDDAVDLLRRQRFQVILSAPVLKVWTRQGPDAGGKWASRNIAGLRSSRLQLLLYMLTHPGTVIGTHNADEICGSDDVSTNALAQTMRCLRSLLHQRHPSGPYLINTKVMVQTGHRHSYIGNGYMINANYSYLVILKKL